MKARRSWWRSLSARVLLKVSKFSSFVICCGCRLCHPAIIAILPITLIVRNSNLVTAPELQTLASPGSPYRYKQKSNSSPVIFRFKVAHRYKSSSASDSKFILQRRPFHKGGCTVNSQDHKCWFPHAILLTPDIGIAVCTAGYNAITFGSPVNTCNSDFMLIFPISFIVIQNRQSYSLLL